MLQRPATAIRFERRLLTRVNGKLGPELRPRDEAGRENLRPSQRDGMGPIRTRSAGSTPRASTSER